MSTVPYPVWPFHINNECKSFTLSGVCLALKYKTPMVPFNGPKSCMAITITVIVIIDYYGVTWWKL